MTTNEIADRRKDDKSFEDQAVGKGGQNVRRYGVAQAQQAQQREQLESPFEQQQLHPHRQQYQQQPHQQQCDQFEPDVQLEGGKCWEFFNWPQEKTRNVNSSFISSMFPFIDNYCDRIGLQAR